MIRERHIVAEESEAGRIVLMDSITHTNATYGPDDVLIGGSWMGVVPMTFAVKHRPRAVICNDGGVGADGGGINGLHYLDGAGIPGAAAAVASVEVGDGRSHWDTGVISHVNHWAKACGCEPGMSVQNCARALLAWRKELMRSAPGREVGRLVYQGGDGEIVTYDSVRFVSERDRGRVLVLGAHGGETACRYALAAGPRGVITSDSGGGRDRSGTRGLTMLAEHGIPAGAASVHSAPIGDGLAIYERGILSAVNGVAEVGGLRVGMRVRDAALELVARAPRGSA